MVREEKGDLLKTPCRYIAHGVNCMNVMGSGVAKVLYEKWPEVKSEYHLFCNSNMRWVVHGQEELLGCVNVVRLGDKVIFNCFTQNLYFPRGKVHLDYDALKKCFEHIITLELRRIAIPKIGCGLAGGDWEKVKKIIDEVTGNKLEVIAYLQ